MTRFSSSVGTAMADMKMVISTPKMLMVVTQMSFTSFRLMSDSTSPTVVGSRKAPRKLEPNMTSRLKTRKPTSSFLRMPSRKV